MKFVTVPGDIKDEVVQKVKKLPVLVNPPSLKSITKESVEIIVDLDYGVNETMPEFWQVQYKEVNESVYRNYSAPLVASFSLLTQSHQTYTIHNLSTETHAYNVRVILTVQNQSSVENIKELKTYKKNLRADRDNFGAISLEWQSIEKDTPVNYIIEYMEPQKRNRKKLQI
ncbi:hypothetical protein MTP99_004765 [Tenebrio molitor]|nr:hypothetical protein MTP99_004765 [Tenebrio molitor]